MVENEMIVCDQGSWLCKVTVAKLTAIHLLNVSNVQIVNENVVNNK